MIMGLWSRGLSCYHHIMRWFLALLLLASQAHADANIGGKVVDCYCTDSTGGRVELGEKICLQVDGRMFMAQCQMSLNVPMWREISEGCLSSSLSPMQSLDPSIDTGGIYPQI